MDGETMNAPHDVRTGRGSEEYRLWDEFEHAGRTHFRYTMSGDDYRTDGSYCAGEYNPPTLVRGIGTTGRAEIEAAFDTWASVSGVTFEAVAWDPNLPDTEVEIIIGMLSDDGIGGRLGATVQAKAISDVCGLNSVLEGNETVLVLDSDDWGWDFGTTGFGTPTQAERNQFYNTALHEIGHAIGIAHSDVTGALMSGNDGNPGTGTPYTDYGARRATLTEDDVAAAQALYGPAHAAPVPSDVHYTNRVIGTPGVDRLYGTSANDVMSGGAGRDLLAGGDGNDLLLGGHEGATLFGQGGADTFVYTGGRNWFMDFDAAEGDRIAGLTAAYLNEGTANGSIGVRQVGENFAIYFGGSPWGDDADVIWLADTTPATGYPGAEWFA